MACATALHMAQEHPDKKILVFSTDPAHSIGDSFDYPIGDKITAINPAPLDSKHLTGPVRNPGSKGTKDIDNLWAYEIAAERLLEEWKEGRVEKIRGLFQKFLGKGVDIVFDREITEELIRCAPPGLNEVFALYKIAELAKEEKFDIYVLDTAASGHLMRFLEVPQIMREWFKTFFRMMLRYREVVRLSDMAKDTIEDSKKIKAVQKILADTENTEFIGVTIPEEMGVQEMERLLASLKGLNIPCHNIIINKVIPPTNCNFCSRKGREQQRYIQQVKKEKSSEYQVTQVSLFPHKIKGIEDLTELSNAMYG